MAATPDVAIFISYRRSDSSAEARQLYDALRRRFGRGNLFMDVDNLRPGEDWVEAIDASIKRCDAVLVLIGQEWAAGTALGENDRVRAELEAAVDQEKLLIPVLVDNAPLPDAERLPEKLRPILRSPAFRLRASSFDADLDALADHVRQIARDKDAEQTGQEATRTAQDTGPVDEDVQFTIYRPRGISVNQWYTMLAFAHLSERRPDAADDEPDPLEEVRRQASQILDDQLGAYQSMTDDSAMGIPREGELTFVPTVPGIEFNPPQRRFIWYEAVHREEFRLRAAQSLDNQVARGRLTVFLGPLIVADINLSFKVATGVVETTRVPETARRYRSIFASYAHEDRDVVGQFAAVAAATGDRLLRDVIELRSGEAWNLRLLELIGRADIFQLFWSWNSMRSRYVRQEWEYALSLGRSNFVRPVYWQSPMPRDPTADLPPPSLSRLHFHSLGGKPPIPPRPSPPSPVVAAQSSATPAWQPAARQGRRGPRWALLSFLVLTTLLLLAMFAFAGGAVLRPAP